MHMGHRFSLLVLNMDCFFPDLASIPFLGWDPGIPPLVSPIGLFHPLGRPPQLSLPPTGCQESPGGCSNLRASPLPPGDAGSRALVGRIANGTRNPQSGEP